MTQEEKRLWLINALLAEQPRYRHVQIPAEAAGQKDLLRSLFNIRGPIPAPREFLRIQDAYLRAETAQKGVTDLSALTPVRHNIYLWRGDITTLRCDAIVNAANSGMLGCFVPCHGCIDNCIHTYAGVQLRLACAGLMRRQGHEEPVGGAKLTPGFNLPSKYVLHTVGPLVTGPLRPEDQRALAGCYRSCLRLAEEKNLSSIAFCCISTGEFHFPPEAAARTAVCAVQHFLAQTRREMKVIFNVFKKSDEELYRRLLIPDGAAEG